MALPRQEHFHKITHNTEFLRLFSSFKIQQGKCTVRNVLGFPSGNKESIEDARGHTGKREMCKRPADVPSGIAILKPPCNDFGEPCTRDDSQLADPGNRLGKAPVRDTGTHSALNNFYGWNSHKENMTKLRGNSYDFRKRLQKVYRAPSRAWLSISFAC